MGLGLVIAVAAVFASIATAQFVAGTDQIRDNTGPVLISTQGLRASLAEADASNTAVFLSGENEDREQLRLYEAALSRAPQQIEDISAGVGDDEVSHDSLKAIASQLTEYARLTERARVRNLAGEPALADLEAALELVNGDNGMLQQANSLTARTQTTLGDDIDAGMIEWLVALVALVVALVALLIAQRNMKKRTNRLINPPLVAATLCVFALGVWLALAEVGRVADLQAARDDASDAIALTAELQTSAFDYKSRESQAIINDDFALMPTDADRASIDELLGRLVRVSDTAGEAAAAQSLEIRWDRYVDESVEVGMSLSRNDVDAAREIAITEGNSDFNGFNTTVENVLLANRDQFESAVASADNRVNWLLLGSIFLPVLAIIFTLVGYQVRINEYW